MICKVASDTCIILQDSDPSTFTIRDGYGHPLSILSHTIWRVVFSGYLHVSAGLLFVHVMRARLVSSPFVEAQPRVKSPNHSQAVQSLVYKIGRSSAAIERCNHCLTAAYIPTTTRARPQQWTRILSVDPELCGIHNNWHSSVMM